MPLFAQRSNPRYSSIMVSRNALPSMFSATAVFCVASLISLALRSLLLLR
jgi:hypothetical protein